MQSRTGLHNGTATNHAERLSWVALILAGGVGLSLFFACVTPFAAMATLSALKLGRRDGAIAVCLVWMANQATGYGFLGYPRTWDSAAWGVAIGVSMGLGLLAAMALAAKRPAPFSVSLPFMAAFAAYELSLYVVSLVLGATPEAFSGLVVGKQFLVNVAAFGGFIAAYRMMSLLGPMLSDKGPDGIPLLPSR